MSPPHQLRPTRSRQAASLLQRRDGRALDVSFQWVVHPAPTEEAEVVETSTCPWESRMDVHKNARLTPLGRERMVKLVLGGQTPQAVGEAVGVCPRTVRKWVERYQSEGPAGLQDRSSRPKRLHRRS